MIQFREWLGRTSYKEIKDSYPSLQERVYRVMRDTFPNEVGMSMKEDFPDLKFNHSFIDSDTQSILVKTLKKKLDATTLMVTNDDLTFCWSRYRELLFLFYGTAQGVLVESADRETGASVYRIKGLDTPFLAKYPVKTKFRTKFGSNYRSIVHIHKYVPGDCLL